jgi:predicted porin
MNKKLLTAVVGATLAVAGNAANAIDLKISGHLARGVMWADDGITSETYHVDMTTSPSRFRLLASDELVPGVRAGVNWEMGWNSNNSGSTSQTAKQITGNANGGFLSERQQEVWFSGALGRVGFGQGDSATKDLISIDLSGTTLGAGGAPGDIGGGLSFRAPTTGTSIVTIGSVLNNFDGARYDRIRYDSPALGPVVISASVGHNGTGATTRDVNEFAARLNMDLGGAGKLAAGLGFIVDHTAGASTAEALGNQETTQMVVSWLSPMGLNVTFAHSAREDDATLDADFDRLQVGFISGEHAISVHYAIGKDQALTDDEAEQLGVSYNFKPKPWADIFASAKTVKLDRTGTTAEDIMIVLVGSRIVF